jgi:hypothetical protein
MNTKRKDLNGAVTSTFPCGKLPGVISVASPAMCRSAINQASAATGLQPEFEEPKRYGELSKLPETDF